MVRFLFCSQQQVLFTVLQLRTSRITFASGKQMSSDCRNFSLTFVVACSLNKRGVVSLSVLLWFFICCVGFFFLVGGRGRGWTVVCMAIRFSSVLLVCAARRNMDSFEDTFGSLFILPEIFILCCSVDDYVFIDVQGNIVWSIYACACNS